MGLHFSSWPLYQILWWSLISFFWAILGCNMIQWHYLPLILVRSANGMCIASTQSHAQPPSFHLSCTSATLGWRQGWQNLHRFTARSCMEYYVKVLFWDNLGCTYCMTKTKPFRRCFGSVCGGDNSTIGTSCFGINYKSPHRCILCLHVMVSHVTW